VAETNSNNMAGHGEKIGLALGGGGARGFGHIPVFRALEELGLKPACVAATSIGALMGAGFCAGIDSHEMEDYCLRSFGSLGEVFSRFWRIRPKSLSELKRRGGIRLSQFHLEEILPSFLPEIVPETFEGLDVPLSVVAVDIILGEVVVIREGSLQKGLAASAALPGVFAPVSHEGRLLVDGGVCNPVPVDCFGSPVDITIAVDITGFEAGSFANNPPSLVESLLVATMMSQRALTAARLATYKTDLVLYPPVGGIYVLNFIKVREIMARVMDFKEEAKRAIAHMMEAGAMQKEDIA